MTLRVRRRGEYARAGFGDGDGVLGVRGVRPVCRAQGPAVGVDDQSITASPPPGFERQRHARPQQQSAPMPSAIGDVGILVHGAAHAMPAELGIDAISGVSGRRYRLAPRSRRDSRNTRCWAEGAEFDYFYPGKGSGVCHRWRLASRTEAFQQFGQQRRLAGREIAATGRIP